jgi:hypothetical protein
MATPDRSDDLPTGHGPTLYRKPPIRWLLSEGDVMPNCHICGAENSTRARFCQNCGVQVGNEISGSVLPPVAPAAPANPNVIGHDEVNKSERWTARTADQLID